MLASSLHQLILYSGSLDWRFQNRCDTARENRPPQWISSTERFEQMKIPYHALADALETMPVFPYANVDELREFVSYMPDGAKTVQNLNFN